VLVALTCAVLCSLRLRPSCISCPVPSEVESSCQGSRCTWCKRPRGRLFPYSPTVCGSLLEGRGAEPAYSVPFYTLHKVLAGLSDVADAYGGWTIAAPAAAAVVDAKPAS